jgi:hypothetical protein
MFENPTVAVGIELAENNAAGAKAMLEILIDRESLSDKLARRLFMQERSEGKRVPRSSVL